MLYIYIWLRCSDERSYKVVKQFVSLISKASKLHQTNRDGSSIGSQSSGGSSIGSANSINLISGPPRGTGSGLAVPLHRIG